MTLDEQIKILENNAEYIRKEGDLQGCLNFKQLAEWLKDYKNLLEQEPCRDCISRAEAIEQYTRWYTDFMSLYDNGNFQDVLKNLPSIQPKPKTDVLDKIKVDIEKRADDYFASGNYDEDLYNGAYKDALYWCFDLIDKYKAERNDKE